MLPKIVLTPFGFRCKHLEQLILVHEEDNQFDPNAIAVKRENDEQLGHLSADLAETVADDIRRGYRYGVLVAGFTGGTEDFSTVGCKLLVIVSEPGVSDQEAVDYINQVVATDRELLDYLGVDGITAKPANEAPQEKQVSFWKRLFG
jgi:hypothetical protein